MKLSLHIVFATVLCIGVNGIPTTETTSKVAKNGKQNYFLREFFLLVFHI